MDDPQIPAPLISHHRPGFYFRVLREGLVQAGDEIVQAAAGPEAMTVAEVDALLYLPGHPRQQVERALRIPALPGGWRDSFQAILGQPETPGAGGNAGLAAVTPPPAWPGFRPLAVTAIERESESVVPVYLADPAGAPVPPALPGQFLTVRLIVGAGPPTLPSYSLSGRQVPIPTGSVSSGSRTAPGAACFSHPGPDDVEGRDYLTRGRVSASVLAALDLPRDAEAYLCGPAAFMAYVSAALAAAGIGHVRSEIFGTGPAQTPGIAATQAQPPHPPPGAPGDDPQVAFARSGLTVHWAAGYASLHAEPDEFSVPPQSNHANRPASRDSPRHCLSSDMTGDRDVG